MQSHADKKKNAADGAAHEQESRAAAHRMPVRERTPTAQPVAPNRTGLPDTLKTGLETLSGLAMDDVRVHYGSPQPAQLQAHAFAQGAHIHVAPGQESHLPHEAWHVVQQMQRRVPVTRQAGNGTPVNDDVHLEREADFMGSKAALNTAKGSAREPLRQAIPFGPAQLGLRGKADTGGGKNDEAEAEAIQALLAQKISEAGQDAPLLTQDEETRVLEFLKNASGALRSTRDIKVTLRNFMLVGDGALANLLNNGRAPQKPKAQKKPRMSAKEKEKAWQKHRLFENAESDESENEEVPLDYLRKNYPNTYKPATDHSRADKQEGEFMDASNTNLLLFRNGSFIPRTINGNPNTDAVRKRKRSLSQKLQDDREELRLKQESFYFGSHLPTDQKGKLVTNDTFKRVKQDTDEKTSPALHNLLSYTFPGFAQSDSHTHGEQSVLRSEIWDNLVKKLVKQLHTLKEAKSKKTEDPEVTTIALVLNRSSCIECARTMSVAVVVFWEEVAKACGYGSAQEARAALGHHVRFVVRFPTIYEHNLESDKGFKNLDAILAGLIETGWQIEPFVPAIKGGKKSYEDLVTRLNKAKGDKGKKHDYHDDNAIYEKAEEDDSSETDMEEEEGDDYRLLRANNCLLRAMNGGGEIDDDILTLIRTELFEGGEADYAGFVEANETTVSVIARHLGITQTIVHVTHMEHEGDAIFVIAPDGFTTEITDEEEKADMDTNAAYNTYGYILIDYAGNHFEKKR